MMITTVNPDDIETISIRKTIVDINYAASIFEIEPALLKTATKKNTGIMSVAEAAKLLSINKETLYAAASKNRSNKFPRAVVPKINPQTGEPTSTASKISILHKDFVGWFYDYKSRKNGTNKPVRMCQFEGCTNQLTGKNKKFCKYECYVNYRKSINEYARLGSLGNEGKGKNAGIPEVRLRTYSSEKAALKKLKPGQKLITVFI